MTIGKGSKLHDTAVVHDEVIVGKNCKIQSFAYLCNGVTLEDNVFIGPHVCFTNDKDFSEPFKISKTLVKKGAKIGANATILAGVVIGENAIIGAGAVVLKHVFKNEVWAGNPATFIKLRE